MAAPGLARLLRPASVAIVGASDKVGPGYNAWRALEHVGFERLYREQRDQPDH